MKINNFSFKEKRRAKGLSQQDLAKLLGLSQGMISLLERGSRGVPVHLVTKLCQVLNCDVKDIVFENTLLIRSRLALEHVAEKDLGMVTFFLERLARK
jgi:transcriptional regulator with XRE-family HTH domain